MQEIILWGATGQAKVVRECLGKEFQIVAVFDNDLQVTSPFADVPIFYGKSGFEKWIEGRETRPECVVAIGGGQGRARVEIGDYLASFGVKSRTLIHRTAFVAGNAIIGAGSQILAQSAVAVEVKMGRACIVNTCASVDHECELEEGVHIAPGAHLAGSVRVGAYAMIGIGAVVLPRLRIGEGAIVGGGAVVIRDVEPYTVVAGNPARIIHR